MTKTERLSNRRSGKAASFQPLNLIPIMNLFITIIPMLLMITVTVHLTLLSLNLMATGEPGPDDNGPGPGQQAPITLIIYPDRFEIRESNREPVILNAEHREGDHYRFDYRNLDRVLREVKDRNPEVITMTVTPYDDVLYDTLLRAIDVCKLTGFSEVRYSRVRVDAV